MSDFEERELCERFLQQLLRDIREHCQIYNVPEYDGYHHYLRVLKHTSNACKYENTTKGNKFAMLIATTLYDIDTIKTEEVDVAKYMLNSVLDNVRPSFVNDEWVQLILDMIEKPIFDFEPNSWMAIPQISNYLDSIGDIGLERLIQSHELCDIPQHTVNTIRVYTSAQLDKVIETYEDKFTSTIDRVYKILQDGDLIETNNRYLNKQLDDGIIVMEEYIIDYWNDVNFDDICNRINDAYVR